MLTEKGGESGEGVVVVMNTHVACPLVFSRISSKVSDFVMACKLYIRIKIREAAAKKQIQWVLSYVQGGSADIWKKNIMKDQEVGV